MNLLQQFISFLLSQKRKSSPLTVKNYKADIRQFIAWFEKEFNSSFDPAKVSPQTIQAYKETRKLSGSSIDRHTSSLRKFFNFLEISKTISYNPVEKRTAFAETQALADPLMIKNYKSFLYECRKSNLTIKNYINDLKSFFAWLEEVALTKHNWNVEDRNLLNKINFITLEEYKQRLIAANFSPLTVNRKLSSLRNYIVWAKNQNIIPTSPTPRHAEFISASNVPVNKPPHEDEILNQVQDDIRGNSPLPPVRLTKKSLGVINFLFDNLLILPLVQALEATQYFVWKITGKKIFKKTVISKSAQKFCPEDVSNVKKEFYAPLNISTRYLPVYRRVWHYLRHVRPNWYKRYHSYSFAHYLHFAILMVLSCAVGFGIYNNFFTDEQTENAVLGTTASAPPKILSFQGKLTDSSGTPIIKDSNILFSLYDDKDATSGAYLWQETNTVKPDQDGIFSVFLGKTTPISDTVFSQNSKLFLGITVGNSPELRPRQELATVPFAGNADTLQGLKPITNTTNTSNVILALDSSGNLSIAGSASHTFQTIGGNLKLSGKVLTLNTVSGSNSNIEITPDGLGKVDILKPIQNSSNNGNLASALGSVEFDDTVAILATSSAYPAFYINQTSTGTLISANTNGSARFTVGSEGKGTFADDIVVNGGDLTSTATTFNLLNSTVTTLNIGGAATTLSLGVSGGATTIKSNLTVNGVLTLPSFTSNGGILYTNGSGRIYQVTAGSSSDCLMGGTTPSFSSCSGSNIFSQASGAVYPSTTSSDLLLGATSTSSALIKLTGTNVAGANNSWFNAGNIGIGTTTPLLKLDVQDSQSATAAAQIFNTNTGTDADGLIVKLGNTSTSAVAASNHFISFETAGIGIVGSVQGNAGTGVTYATSGIADFAEYLKKDKSQTIEYGSVICLGNNGLAVKCDSDNNNVVGVASERPAFLGGKNLGNGSIAVGLTGQVETLVAAVNGEIKAGDMLTPSDIPGVAMKTARAGQIVGKALENSDITDESRIAGYYDPDNKEYRSKSDFPSIPLKSTIIRVIKIPTLVSVSWYDPGTYLAQNGDLIINNIGSNGYSVSNSRNEILTNIEGFFEIIAANIKAGLINASKVVTDSLIVTSDSIIVNGQNLKEYIAQVIEDSGLINPGTISPVVNTDRLATNIISPLSSPALVIKLSTPSGSLIVQNSSGSAVTSIDSAGKIIANEISVNQASISGNLNASDANISGTLRAGNILADSISGLDAKISSYVSLASYSAQLSNIPDFSAERGQFNQGLMVFGPTSLSDLSVVGRLSIGGTLFVTENSLETLGTDLSLQSLKQGGLSIMAGLVYIDTEGNTKIQGDLSISGKLAVNVISPLSSSDLVINNASGSGVLSVNQTGDLVASGSGTFAKLNFSLIQPVLAVSATEVIASSSAGIANIAPYQSELTINNNLVTDKSVIYITPVGTPSAQTPFLMRQTPSGPALSGAEGSFTVGVQSPTNHPIDFNWLIVN